MITVLSLPHSTLLKTTLWIRCPARFIIIVLLVYLNVKAIAMGPFQSCVLVVNLTVLKLYIGINVSTVYT